MDKYRRDFRGISSVKGEGTVGCKDKTGDRTGRIVSVRVILSYERGYGD